MDFNQIAGEHGVGVAFLFLVLVMVGGWVSIILKKRLGGNSNTSITQENRADLSADIQEIQKQQKVIQDEIRDMVRGYKEDKREYNANHIILTKLEMRVDSLDLKLTELKLKIDK